MLKSTEMFFDICQRNIMPQGVLKEMAFMENGLKENHVVA